MAKHSLDLGQDVLLRREIPIWKFAPTLLLIVKIQTAGAQNLTISYDFEIHRPGSKALKHLNVVFNVCQCTWREHLEDKQKFEGWWENKNVFLFSDPVFINAPSFYLFLLFSGCCLGFFCEVYVWHRLYVKLFFNLATYMLMSPWFTGLLHVC